LYRRLKQNVEAMQRQIQQDPSASFAKPAQETSQASAEQKQATLHSEEDKENAGTQHKRAAIDKQAAFVEYKQTGEGRALESSVVALREEVRARKTQIQALTQAINLAKREMDRVQARLQQK
jgi:hypothetical protein